MVNRFSSRMIWWLALALGVLAFAGCQSGVADPTPIAVQQAASVEPTSTLVPTETAVEQPETGPQPTPTSAARPATSDLGETVEPEITQEAETEEQSTMAADSDAANADVEYVRATLQGDGSWRFEVTVRHPDTGWEDYADGWDVVTPDGLVLKVKDSDPFTRLLLHPHENEQPFTRSQSGIVLPEGVTVVTVRAHDLVDGFGGREVRVDLLSDGGADFEVIRE